MTPSFRAATFDIDGTILDRNPNFRFPPDGHLILDGQMVKINPTFVPTDDTLVNLREAVGSINPATGFPVGRDHDYQCRVMHEISFAEHLRLQFEDVLDHISVDQCIELAALTMVPKPGARTLMRKLTRHNVVPVFATNGADLIAHSVLCRFFGDILGTPSLVANKIVDGKFRELHGENGLDKDIVVRNLGNVVLFAGDSGRGDGPGAKATAELGGHVLAVGHQGPGSLYHYCQKNLPVGTWSALTSYRRGGRRRYKAA